MASPQDRLLQAVYTAYEGEVRRLLNSHGWLHMMQSTRTPEGGTIFHAMVDAERVLPDKFWATRGEFKQDMLRDGVLNVADQTGKRRTALAKACLRQGGAPGAGVAPDAARRGLARGGRGREPADGAAVQHQVRQREARGPVPGPAAVRRAARPARPDGACARRVLVESSGRLFGPWSRCFKLRGPFASHPTPTSPHRTTSCPTTRRRSTTTTSSPRRSKRCASGPTSTGKAPSAGCSTPWPAAGR